MTRDNHKLHKDQAYGGDTAQYSHSPSRAIPAYTPPLGMWIRAWVPICFSFLSPKLVFIFAERLVIVNGDPSPIFSFPNFFDSRHGSLYHSRTSNYQIDTD
jgi:hypothetical protein